MLTPSSFVMWRVASANFCPVTVLTYIAANWLILVVKPASVLAAEGWVAAGIGAAKAVEARAAKIASGAEVFMVELWWIGLGKKKSRTSNLGPYLYPVLAYCKSGAIAVVTCIYVGFSVPDLTNGTHWRPLSQIVTVIVHYYYLKVSLLYCKGSLRVH